MKKIDYIERTNCAITGESEFEPAFGFDFPLFCGCTNEPQSEDLVARMNFVIFKPSGVVQLKNLVPLDVLYKNGHDAGSVGALWEEHHSEFASFVMSFKPKKLLEIGGGHGKLALKCLEKDKTLSYTIIEPNSTKHEKITYIDSFFGKEKLDTKYDTIVHSHTFEHIYEPNLFLTQIYEALSGGLNSLNAGECGISKSDTQSVSSHSNERERERRSANLYPTKYAKMA